MAALQCEICGGKLIGKPGGVFECDSCGMEYSTDWAKAKIQEIKGTVKVEGTVEVQGKVQVEGAANKDSLLKRGFMALEDTKWNDADESFDKALDIDPECAEAYLGKLMAEMKVSKRENLKDGVKPFDSSNNYQKVLRFGDVALADDIRAANKNCMERNHAVQDRVRLAANRIAAGSSHTIGLKTDGTIATTLYPCGKRFYNMQCEVDDWAEVTAVAAGSVHTVGLKADGTVIAVGNNDEGQCETDDWQNIVAVAAGGCHTIGLKTDRTVVATEFTGDRELFYYGQCEVDDWTDIVEIAAGDYHTVGLRTDGTVVSTDDNTDICGWRNIIAISAGDSHIVGLKSNGTVVAAGNNKYDQCNVGDWQDIVAIAAGNNHTVGLKVDGTVVAVGDNRFGRCNVSSWTDIVAIAAGFCHTVGLKSDGSVVATKYAGSKEDYCGQCDVSSWRLFGNIDTLEEECAAAKKASKERRVAEEKAAEERRLAAKKAAEERRQAQIAVLNSEKSAFSTELTSLKGLFAGKRRKEIEARLVQIDAELKKLNG